MAELRIELTEAVAERLTRFAKWQDATPEEMLVRLAEGLARDGAGLDGDDLDLPDPPGLRPATLAEFEAEIAEAEADVAAGRIHSHEDVMRELYEIIAAAERRKAG